MLESKTPDFVEEERNVVESFSAQNCSDCDDPGIFGLWTVTTFMQHSDAWGTHSSRYMYTYIHVDKSYNPMCAHTWGLHVVFVILFLPEVHTLLNTVF